MPINGMSVYNLVEAHSCVSDEYKGISSANPAAQVKISTGQLSLRVFVNCRMHSDRET